MTQRLDGLLEAQPHLGVVELAAAQPLADALEVGFGRGALLAELLEHQRHLPRRVGLQAALLAQGGDLGLDQLEARRDEAREAVERHRLAVELDPAAFGGLALGDVAGEPFLDLTQAALQELATVVEAG